MRHPFLVPIPAAGLLAACTVPDGDLSAVPALVGLEVAADTESVDALTTHVTGTLTLGYTSPERVAVTVRDNETLVYSASFEAKNTTLPIDATLSTLFEGANTLVVQAEYLGDVVSASTQVLVPAGVLSLGLEAPPEPTTLETTIEGTYALGWTSTLPATLELWVEGQLASSQVLDGTAGEGTFSVDLPLPHAGTNTIVADLRYGEGRRSASVSVDVPGPLEALDVSLPSSSSGFEVDLTGQLEVGYESDHPALLQVLVDGLVVVSQDLDLSTSPSTPFSATVPLSHPGANEVVTRVLYEGAEAARTASVDVVPPEPGIALPAWTIDFVPSQTLTARGDVEVIAAEGWTVEEVRGSMDGGQTWIASSGSPDWTLSFPTPDLSQAVVVSVITSNRGIRQEWLRTDILPVDLIFDCNDRGAMVPQEDLLRDMRTEYRTMTGYFGAPDGAHVVSFAITSDTESSGPYPEVASLQQAGPFAMDVAFNVDQYRCGQGCSQPYDLEVLLDGARHCFEPAYGQIEERN